MRSEGWSPWALGEGTGLSHLGRAASGSGGGGGSWGHWDEEECVSLCQAHPLGLLLVVGLPLVTTLFSASNESPRIRGGQSSGARPPSPPPGGALLPQSVCARATHSLPSAFESSLKQ